LYLAELMPNTLRILCLTSTDFGVPAHYHYACTLNGTLHAYLTYFHWFLQPSGSGFYIHGSRVSMTLVMPRFYYSGSNSFRGPIAFDALSNPRLHGGAPSNLLIHYNIGPPPGDGFFMAVLLGAVAQGSARLMYLSENATGYFLIQRPPGAVGAGYATFHRRYALVDVALEDALYLYNTRGFACPISYYNVGWGLEPPRPAPP